MSQPELPNPFHPGELEAQTRAGVGDVAQWAGGFIREYLPEQHRAFHTALPFFIVTGADTHGNVWTTLIEGRDGFAKSPNAVQLLLDTLMEKTDPLAECIGAGTYIGVLGIELASRRRNRFSGYIRPGAEGYVIDIVQSFGNCPQYINQREWTRAERAATGEAFESSFLDDTQKQLIAQSDTMFIGSGHFSGERAPSRGFDASHRGGSPGFVDLLDDTHLRIPDYAGNNFFNTIGNLITDPRVGLLFIDFQTGSLLHISGTASVEWSSKNTDNAGALRTIDVQINSVLYRPQSVSLRWAKQEHQAAQLQLVKREAESANITSLYFASNNDESLKPYKPGQHLPIELQIPGQAGASTRSYSLSGPTTLGGLYRISVKREDKGLVSRYLHDELRQGNIISAQAPSGDFLIPCSRCPLVLISAGVGFTPLLSMLHETAGQDRPIWFVHGTRNGQHHALKNEVDRLVLQNDNVKQYIYHSQPDTNDVQGRDYDVKGRILASHLLSLNAGSEAHYLLCGPATFISDIRKGLESAGVLSEQIHHETFG